MRMHRSCLCRDFFQVASVNGIPARVVHIVHWVTGMPSHMNFASVETYSSRRVFRLYIFLHHDCGYPAVSKQLKDVHYLIA